MKQAEVLEKRIPSTSREKEKRKRKKRERVNKNVSKNF